MENDLKEAKNKFSAMALRYFYLQAHYRSKQNFTWEALNAAGKAYEKMVKKLISCGKECDYKDFQVSKEWKGKFIKEVENDFNMPGALGVAWKMLKSDLAPNYKVGTLLDFDKIFGLDLDNLLLASAFTNTMATTFNKLTKNKK